MGTAFQVIIKKWKTIMIALGASGCGLAFIVAAFAVGAGRVTWNSHWHSLHSLNHGEYLVSLVTLAIIVNVIKIFKLAVGSSSANANTLVH